MVDAVIMHTNINMKKINLHQQIIGFSRLIKEIQAVSRP